MYERTLFGIGVLSALLSACVEDVSSLTKGYGGAGDSQTTPLGAGGNSAGSGGAIDHGGREAGVAGEGVDEGGSSTGGAAQDPACIPQGTEICNGSDDDCDGSVDEGCPVALAWTLQPDRDLLGGTGGDLFGDQCDSTELLTGVKATFEGWLTQIRGVCSTVAVAPDTSITPYEYRVALSNPRELTAHPDGVHEQVAVLQCPPNRALVGLRIAQQPVSGDADAPVVISRIGITCAGLSLQADGTLALQDTTDIGPLSGETFNDSAASNQDFAPVPELAVRLTGAAGSWVDRLGFATGKPRIILR